MEEENKEVTTEETQKKERTALIVFIVCIVVVLGIIAFSFISSYIKDKKSEERIMKALNHGKGLQQEMQDAVDTFKDESDQIIEDMKNNPKLK